MFKPVNTVQLYDPYTIELLNRVAQLEDRRPASCARFYLTKILMARLRKLSQEASNKDSSQQPASVVG